MYKLHDHEFPQSCATIATFNITNPFHCKIILTAITRTRINKMKLAKLAGGQRNCKFSWSQACARAYSSLRVNAQRAQRGNHLYALTLLSPRGEHCPRPKRAHLSRRATRALLRDCYRRSCCQCSLYQPEDAYYRASFLPPQRRQSSLSLGARGNPTGAAQWIPSVRISVRRDCVSVFPAPSRPRWSAVLYHIMHLVNLRDYERESSFSLWYRCCGRAVTWCFGG